MKNKIVEFIANNWVSWLIEIIAMVIIASYTISEVRKTGEETRATIARFEEKISLYASDKSAAVEEAVKSAKETTSADIDSAKEAIKGFFKKDE